MNYAMKGKTKPAPKKKMGMAPKAKMAKGGYVKKGMACGGMAKGKK